MKKSAYKKVTNSILKKAFPSSANDFLKGTKDLDGLIKFEKDLKAQLLWSHIRANKKIFREKLGKAFDVWFNEYSKEPVVEKHRNEYLLWLKKLRTAKGELKNKPKQIVAPVSKPIFKDKIEQLAYELNKMSADSMGLTVEEYLEWRKKSLAERKKYDEEHWVSPLTDGQVFTILYQNENAPYSYMGKPVSKENEWKINRYKKFNKGWIEFKNKKNNFNKAVSGQLLPKEIQEAGNQYRKMVDSVNQTLKPLKQTIDKIKSWGNPFDIAHIYPMSAHPKWPDGLLTEQRIIEKKDNGLDSYAKRIGAKSGIEIVEHYLKTFEDPTKVDYAVTSFENTGAIAEACGLSPAETFVALCQYIKRSKTKLVKRIFEQRNAFKIEELVNHYLSEKQRHEDKNLGALTMTKFYATKYVKDFLKDFPYELDYKRFDEKMKSWIKIYTSTAKKIN